jgi:protein SCO1
MHPMDFRRPPAAVFAAMYFWPSELLRDDATGTQPAFRADFELTAHREKVKRDEDSDGKGMIAFFGFTNCPEACPTTVSEVAAALDGSGSNPVIVQRQFISIDPERDAPAALAEIEPVTI